ncbi:hypothetical protein [Phenylobacterium sp.]|uniref:hypothetical protein n=1 Tax=Phenylobacterium sp. TaxID=1871053 RepID=UPI0012245A2E|nr:hypothetical protein [Phenylobacterium sp.]THD54142.1 MAG: hypothetical protein E8A12_17710 [Phenylobacterium sp.]
MDWGEELAIYSFAKAEFDRAHCLLEQAMARFETARSDETASLAPLILGVELARRRALRQSRHLDAATYRFTNGRALDEVLWSLPDDI